MANERILRYTNQYGTLSTALNGTDTTSTIGFTTAPSFATVGSASFVKLILDPGTSSQETVYLTAYTAGASTGTIARGMEGTTTVAHSAATGTWVHGPTAYDYPITADTPWGGNLGYDYEFDAPFTTSLPSTTGGGTWQWVNQRTSTYVENFGSGTLMSASSSGGDNTVSIVQSLPTSWTYVYAKLCFMGIAANYVLGGLTLRDSTTGRAYNFYLGYWSTYASPAYFVVYQASATGGNTNVGNLQMQGMMGRFYVRVFRVSSTSFEFDVSYDGITWYPVITGVNPSGNIPAGFNQVGLAIDPSASTSTPMLSCEWLRVR